MALDFEKFELDPGWEMMTARTRHPRPQRGITYDGVVVGYLLDCDGSEPSRVVAIGKDAEIQKELDIFFRIYTAREERRYQEEQDTTRRIARQRAADKLSEAKKAMFGS